MADAPYVNTGIPTQNSQCINKQKIFLKESVHIYKILRVLDITKFHPNVPIIRELWYTSEISPELEEPPTWKDTVVHTTSCRILQVVHSASHWQIPHSKSKVNLIISFLSQIHRLSFIHQFKASVPVPQHQQMAQDTATRSIGLQQLILALPILQGISCFYTKPYPYDTYHDCDTTLVTLGGVLAHFSMEKRSCFCCQGGSQPSWRMGVDCMNLDRKYR